MPSKIQGCISEEVERYNFNAFFQALASQKRLFDANKSENLHENSSLPL